MLVSYPGEITGLTGLVTPVSLHRRYPSPLLRSAVLFGEKRGCRQVLDTERAEVSREIWREGSKGLTKSKATMMVPAWMDGDLVVIMVPKNMNNLMKL